MAETCHRPLCPCDLTVGAFSKSDRDIARARSRTAKRPPVYVAPSGKISKGSPLTPNVESANDGNRQCNVVSVCVCVWGRYVDNPPPPPPPPPSGSLHRDSSIACNMRGFRTQAQTYLPPHAPNRDQPSRQARTLGDLEYSSLYWKVGLTSSCSIHFWLRASSQFELCR